MYELADLTDIVDGRNDRYSAGPGYNLLTGMGVPNLVFTKAWLEQNGVRTYKRNGVRADEQSGVRADAWLEQDSNVRTRAWLEQKSRVGAAVLVALSIKEPGPCDALVVVVASVR